MSGFTKETAGAEAADATSQFTVKFDVDDAKTLPLLSMLFTKNRYDPTAVGAVLLSDQVAGEPPPLNDGLFQFW
jgi:hypothetical protein